MTAWRKRNGIYQPVYTPELSRRRAGFGGRKFAFGNVSSTGSVVSPVVGSSVTVTSVTQTTAFVGDSITINGTGFVTGQAVLIDGVTVVTKTVDSSIQITATIPSGVSSGLADVTVAGVTLSNAFTVGGALDEPVYNASNADYVLYLFDDFANVATGDLAHTRSDGGAQWAWPATSDDYITIGGTDGKGSTKSACFDYDTIVGDGSESGILAPHGTGAHDDGYHWRYAYKFGGTYNDGVTCTNTGVEERGIEKPASLLASTEKDSWVIEWTERWESVGGFNVGAVLGHSGTTTVTHWDGKDHLIYVGAVSAQATRLQNDCWEAPISADISAGYTANTDPLILTEYEAGSSGTTPLRDGVAPTYNRWGFNMSSNATNSGGGYTYQTTRRKQNRNWGTGAGEFDALTNADRDGNGAFWGDGTWRWRKIRWTKDDTVLGRGRCEMWVGATNGSLLKTHEWLGDLGQRHEGLIRVHPPGINLFPITVFDHYQFCANRYVGGCKVHVGQIRFWGMSRGEL